MTKQEIKEWILENCINEQGDIDLSHLDFSDFDGNITTSYMKTKRTLYQGHQEVGGQLYQENQTVCDDLFQNDQTVGNWLLQNRQKVGGCLLQYDNKEGDNKVKFDKLNNKIRKEQAIKSYADMAREAGIPVHMFCDIRSGRLNWSLQTLAKMAKYFNCGIDDLVEI